MNKRRRVVLVLLVLFTVCLTALLPAGSLAAAVKVAPGVSGVPPWAINDLKEEYGSADVLVTVLAWGGSPGGKPGDEAEPAAGKKAAGEEAGSSIDSRFSASPEYSYTDIVKTIKQANVPAKNAFICSAAKGEEYILPTTYKASISGSASGFFPISKLGITETLEYTAIQGSVYKGPEEGSQYNSREFRVKFYADEGAYSTTRTLIAPPWTTDYIIGNWTGPSCWYSYSVDRMVE